MIAMTSPAATLVNSHIELLERLDSLATAEQKLREELKHRTNKEQARITSRIAELRRLGREERKALPYRRAPLGDRSTRRTLPKDKDPLFLYITGHHPASSATFRTASPASSCNSSSPSDSSSPSGSSSNLHSSPPTSQASQASSTGNYSAHMAQLDLPPPRLEVVDELMSPSWAESASLGLHG